MKHKIAAVVFQVIAVWLLLTAYGWQAAVGVHLYATAYDWWRHWDDTVGGNP